MKIQLTNPIASKKYDNYHLPDTLTKPKENSSTLALEAEKCDEI